MEELKFDQIKNLDAGIWKGSEFKQQTLVTLRQLLSWQKKYNMNINYEIKCENINTNRVINLAIFTPIFILYPVAEIEVLARKEVIVFSSFL